MLDAEGHSGSVPGAAFLRSTVESAVTTLDLVTPEELVLAQFPGKVYITLVAAGAAIGMKSQTCYNLHHEGKFPLPVRRIGRKPMVALTDLIAYMTVADTSRHAEAAPSSPPKRRGRPRAADREN